jgi:hypothetical protein
VSDIADADRRTVAVGDDDIVMALASSSWSLVLMV